MGIYKRVPVTVLLVVLCGIYTVGDIAAAAIEKSQIDEKLAALLVINAA